MRRHAQQLLFPPQIDVRFLRDEERTLLEAIDKRGPLNVADAGRIVCRLRNRRRPFDVDGLRSIGWRPIKHLRELGLITRLRDGRWARATTTERRAA